MKPRTALFSPARAVEFRESRARDSPPFRCRDRPRSRVDRAWRRTGRDGFMRPPPRGFISANRINPDIALLAIQILHKQAARPPMPSTSSRTERYGSAVGGRYAPSQMGECRFMEKRRESRRSAGNRYYATGRELSGYGVQTTSKLFALVVRPLSKP